MKVVPARVVPVHGMKACGGAQE